MNEPKLIIIIYALLKVEIAWLSAAAATMWVCVCVCVSFTRDDRLYYVRISTYIMLLCIDDLLISFRRYIIRPRNVPENRFPKCRWISREGYPVYPLKSEIRRIDLTIYNLP